jgi:hypothetical protein
MKLYQIFFQYGEHEEENELFAAENNDHQNARAYLLKMYGSDGGYMDDPKQLAIDSVHEFNTVHASNGDPYLVKLTL